MATDHHKIFVTLQQHDYSNQLKVTEQMRIELDGGPEASANCPVSSRQRAHIGLLAFRWQSAHRRMWGEAPACCTYEWAANSRTILRLRRSDRDCPAQCSPSCPPSQA